MLNDWMQGKYTSSCLFFMTALVEAKVYLKEMLQVISKKCKTNWIKKH